MDFVLWNEGTFSEKLFSGIRFWIRWIAEKVGSGNRTAEGEAEEDEKSVRAFHQNAERLLDTHGSAVLRMAYSYLHNMSDAEDILQETYLAAYSKLDRFQGGNLTGWLVTIGKNLAINEYQKRRKEINVDFQENESLFGVYRVEERTETPLLDLADKILSEEEFQILTLCAVAGYKRREVAEILKIPLGTVTWRYHEAIKKLKAQWREEA